MTHAFIIRFHYAEDDARFWWRLAYFKAMVLPRLMAQRGCGPFDICVWCNEWHDAEFEKLGLKIFRPGLERRDRKNGYWVDFVPWDSIKNLERYDIQSGLDSDDLVAPDYAATIEQTIRERSHGRPMHLCFQEDYFDVKALSIKPMRMRYNAKKGSAFFSIYQPEKKTMKYIFAYEASHLRLWKFFPQSVVLPRGKCWASVHGLNESTRV